LFESFITSGPSVFDTHMMSVIIKYIEYSTQFYTDRHSLDGGSDKIGIIRVFSSSSSD